MRALSTWQKCFQWAAGFLALAAALPPSAAWAQPPSLSYLAPSAIPPGKRTDVTLFGGNLAGASGLWLSCPGQVELAPGIEKNGTDAGKVVYRITLPADAAPGVAALRYATDKGISNLRLFLIDDLPTLADNGQNKSLSAAQELAPPCAVDGACEPESFDFYKVNAKAGQRISAEVYAVRLGSALDPVMRVIDPAGRELAYSDDEPGLGPDARLSLIVPADGVYFIELRDIRYQGGGGHRYRLRVGDFPLVSGTYPLAIPKTGQAHVQPLGASVEGLGLVAINPPDDGRENTSLALRFPQGQSAAAVSVVLADAPDQLETEPNNKLEEATSITLPGAISGRLEQPKDRDWFRFEAKKGQRFVFTGQTRNLGLPTDLLMRIHKSDGAKLAEADDAGTEEGVLDFNVPEDGVFYLAVEDLVRRGGPQHAYRVVVRPYEPGFKLALEVDKADVPKGGVFVVKVTAARDGYNGPITLELDGAGEGFTLANHVIPEGKPETVMSVTVPAQIAPGQMLNLKIVGKAKIGDRDFASRASTLVALRKAFVGLAYPPADLLASVGVGVGQPFPPFFQIAAEPVPIVFPRVIAQGTLKVKATRMNGFDEAVNLAVEGLPGGFSATAAPVAKGQGEAAVTIAGPPDAAEGEHKITIKGSATFQNQPQTVVLSELVLKVVPPVEVALSLPATMAQGGKDKAKVTVTRHGGEKGALAVALANLPKGVTAPETIQIAEGQNEVEFELVAAADAVVGKTENVVATVKTKIKDQDVSVDSKPGVLEVKAP